MGNSDRTRIEPIFNLKTPVLFAHRGGALEKPESTPMAFTYALDSPKVDVLELDVQLTKDGEFVVWHGPSLKNVLLENERTKPCLRDRNQIYLFTWSELDGQAWVADPEIMNQPYEDIDLSAVPRENDRCLMRLADCLKRYPDSHLNIEMKESFSMRLKGPQGSDLKDHVKAFAQILDADGGSRKIVVVSAKDDIIHEFRRCTDNRYPTGLAKWEQFFYTGHKKKGFAFETSHAFVNEGLVERVHDSGGSIFVFLTGLFWPFVAIDKKSPSRKKIFSLLDMGVDGLMTDRPQAVREIIDRWRA